MKGINVGDKHPNSPIKLTHPEWSKKATIYQINTRQFTEEGTFRSAESHLPRLKELGVDIVWLMPIHEIGVVNRKGSLGSPYAVKDFYSVNPEFGTLNDFKHLVQAVHAHDMSIIIGWVPNHTAWDSVLVEQHPEWYIRDDKGDFRPTTWWNWSDIIELDYQHTALRQYMTEAMCYWVRETDIDGFRCDVAGFVPTDYWNSARKELDAIKPVFMLAEWEARDLHYEAFDMTYAWTWYDAVHEIAMGKADVGRLFVYYSWNEKAFPQDIMRMMFVSNHDKNSWDGTMFEQFGDALHAVIVLSVIGEGMPLVYNGQEAGNAKRLEFFERDPIEWQTHEIGTLYRKLFELKKQNSALWNAAWGARMQPVTNDVESKVLSFVRQNEEDKVFAAFNFSAETQSPTFLNDLHSGTYTNYFTGEQLTFSAPTQLTLPAWGYCIFVR